MRRTAAIIMTATAALAVSAAPAHADGIRDSQWHLGFLDVAEAHRHSLGVSVTVAVVDSGVDATHPDLVDNVLPGVDATGAPAGLDVDGRGTGLAGLIAGHGHGAGRPATNGADGILGIAPGARILPVAITSRPGQFGDPDVLADGINLAVARGATVICVGRGLPASPRLEQAVANAVRANVVVVAPTAGRRGENFLPWPASYPGVLAVAPLDRTGALAVPPSPVPSATAAAPASPGATTAPGVPTLTAPGTDLLSTDSGGGYRFDAGTASAGVVAGAAALVRARYPQLPADEVVRRLTQTVAKKGQDPAYGSGVLDLVAALTQQVPALARPSPTPATTPAVAASPTAAGAPAPVPPQAGHAAFDTDDYRRWLVTLPLVVFVIGLAWFAARGRSAR